MVIARRVGSATLMLTLVFALGCQGRQTASQRDGGWPDDGGWRPDGDHTIWDGSPIDPCGPNACGPEELCGPDGRGDGLDNDCDGQVDETCSCEPMTDSESCFPGPPDRHMVGACSPGVQNCSEFGTWSDCYGAVTPTDEVCDGMDNDCDGSVDEGLDDCDSTLECPGGRGATPLSSFALIGSEIYDGPFTSWLWEVQCPPTVPAGSCPAPTDPTAQNTEVYFIASGTYRVTVTVNTPDGEFQCSFAVFVQGSGLRVELNWDTQGSGRGDTDVDLHLHRPGVQSDFFTDDDCYYMNCKASTYSLDWGMLPTDDISGCQDAPHGEGDSWRGIGVCYNPRLDVDVINCDPSVTDATDWSFCAPENINVDNPIQGDVFRVMVNYYSQHSHSGVTHPSVNIYCGGELRASFGAAGDVTLSNGDGYGQDNDNWHVADLRFYTDECGDVTCEVRPLEQIIRGPDFGSPWSW